MLSFKSVIVLLRFKSVIYFELISAYGVKCVLAFVIPVYRCLIVPSPSVEKTMRPSRGCSASCPLSVEHICGCLFPGLYYIP